MLLQNRRLCHHFLLSPEYFQNRLRHLSRLFGRAIESACKCKDPVDRRRREVKPSVAVSNVLPQVHMWVQLVEDVLGLPCLRWVGRHPQLSVGFLSTPYLQPSRSSAGLRRCSASCFFQSVTSLSFQWLLRYSMVLAGLCVSLALGGGLKMQPSQRISTSCLYTTLKEPPNADPEIGMFFRPVLFVLLFVFGCANARRKVSKPWQARMYLIPT